MLTGDSLFSLLFGAPCRFSEAPSLPLQAHACFSDLSQCAKELTLPPCLPLGLSPGQKSRPCLCKLSLPADTDSHPVLTRGGPWQALREGRSEPEQRFSKCGLGASGGAPTWDLFNAGPQPRPPNPNLYLIRIPR